MRQLTSPIKCELRTCKHHTSKPLYVEAAPHMWVVVPTGEGLERSSGTHGGTGTGLSAPTIRLLRRSTLSASENTVPVNATQSR